MGTYGQSYLAAVQYMVAAEAAPSLRAQMPVSGSTDFRQSWISHSGGAFEYGWMPAYAIPKARNTAVRLGLDPELPELESFLGAGEGFRPLLDEAARDLPLTVMADPMSEIAPYYADYLANPEDGPHWWNINLRRRFHEVNQPMYQWAPDTTSSKRARSKASVASRAGAARTPAQTRSCSWARGRISARPSRRPVAAATSTSAPTPRSS